VLINWFTVFAQVLNFLILVALLRWFLYKPILTVMQKRQALIQEGWKEAEQLQTEAQQILNRYQQQQQQFQQQQATLLAEAQAAADQERQHQLAQVRREIDDQRVAWQNDLHQAQAAVWQTLRQQVAHQTIAIARQALQDLANADLEQQIFQVFCDRLQQLDEPSRQAITLAMAQTQQPILIRSSFEISPALRQRLMDNLRHHWGADPAMAEQPIEFGLDPELLCGMAIKLAGQDIVWSLDTYLQTLEQRLSSVLRQESLAHHEPHRSADAGGLR
jgi:F-type H+-transporting ATPase subunit b